ncbi:MAG: hypothetical protein ABIQ86_13485 [Steroidobacteraceae bacterium]
MIHRALFATGLTVFAGAAFAEVDYSLRTGASYTDNVFREPDSSKRDSSTLFAGLTLDGSRPVGRLRYDLTADLAAYKYLSVDVNQSVQGRANLRGVYDFIPESFSWNAGLGYDQYRDDITRPLAPGNLDTVVNLSTGPTLRLHLSDRTSANLDGHYMRTTYKRRDYDSETLGGRATVMRQAGARVSVGVGVSTDEISYISDGGGGSNGYDRSEAFIKADVKGARTDIGTEVGYSKLKNELIKDDGLVLRAHLRRKLTPALTGYINATREYGASDEFVGGFRGTVVDIQDDTPVTAGARLNKNIDAGLDYRRSRSGFGISWSRRQEDGRISGAPERTYNEMGANISRQITARLHGALTGGLMHEKFSNLPSSADENFIGASLDWTFGRALGLGMRLEHRNRDGVTGAGNYSEFNGSLYLSYHGK